MRVSLSRVAFTFATLRLTSMSSPSPRGQSLCLAALPWDTDVVVCSQTIAPQAQQLSVSQLMPTIHSHLADHVVRNVRKLFVKQNRPQSSPHCNPTLLPRLFGTALVDLQPSNAETAGSIRGWLSTSSYIGFLTSATAFIHKPLAPFPFINGGLLPWETRNSL